MRMLGSQVDYTFVAQSPIVVCKAYILDEYKLEVLFNNLA